MMNLDGQGVGAGDHYADRNGVTEERGFVGRIDRGRGQSLISHQAGRHIGTSDFHTIEIDNGTIIAPELKSERSELAGVGNTESSAEVGGDEVIVGWAAIDGGGHGIAVAEGSRAGEPGGVVEGRSQPGGVLVGASVEIFPRTALSDEGDGAAGDSCGCWRRR